ncbi:MAG: branched-chain amino acid ABC transporter permease, partial [Pirellulales bacterium]
MLFAAASATASQTFVQHCLTGLTIGSLIALIALGYTMVYGIIGLINFAHGDLFMLGSFLALTLVGWMGLDQENISAPTLVLGILGLLVASTVFCGTLNVAVDRVVYRPLRNAPKLAPLVSALGVSFVFMNIGQLWGGVADRNFPALVADRNLLGASAIHFGVKDLLVMLITIPLMAALTLFV